MSTSVEDIVKVIEALQQRPTGSLALFENVLSEICEYLKDISKYCTTEHPEGMPPMAMDGAELGANIAAALAGIQINAPPVNVEVAAPNITLQIPEAGALKGWTFDVTQRDELGRIRQFRASPEN